MADTNMNAFVNSCAGYVHTYILGPIVQHLTTKGVQVSVEELAGVLQLPARAATAHVLPPAAPAMAFGGAVPAMAPAVAPTNRKTAATIAPVAGRTCMYQFKRGENKGKFCGKGTAPGNEFCNSCLKTRKNIAKDMAAGTIPGAAPAMGAIPGMAGLPPGYSTPVVAAPAQNGQLTVVPYDEARGLFLEPTHKFIVTQINPGVIAVLGLLREETNEIVALTAHEQAVARSIGLVLDSNPAPTTPSPVPTAPAPGTPSPVPAIPTVPTVVPAAIPAIPTGVPAIPTGVPTIPTGVPAIQQELVPSGAPTLPIITALAGQGPTTTAPVATGVPQIPGIPQINM